MSSGDPFVQCLICPDKVAAKEMLQHIHNHVNYRPLKCKDCNFWCINQNEFDNHTFLYKHEGDKYTDPYKQWLVNGINKDTLYAGRHGLKALLSEKKIGSISDGAPRRPRRPFEGLGPRRHSPSSSPSPNRHALPTSEEDEDTPPRQRVVQKTRTPPTTNARRSDTRALFDPAGQQRRNSDDGESEDNTASRIEKYRQQLAKKFAKCELCTKKVNNIQISLDVRQKHVRDEHMGGVKGPAYQQQQQLEQRTKEAFPNLVWNCRQCSKCKSRGANHEVQQTASRSGHVTTYHQEFFNALRCPWTGCSFESVDPKSFPKHFQQKHGTTKNWKLFVPEMSFIGDYVAHKSKIDQLAELLFAVELPLAPNSAKKKRRSGGNSEDEVEDFVRTAMANAPTGPAGAKLALKRRRSKSEDGTSEEEDEEEDSDNEEKPSDRRGQAAQQRQASSGADDEQMDVDDKEEAKSGHSTVSISSLCSTAAVVGIVGGQGDATMSESGSEVKIEKEIKEEPKTPNTRRVGPLASNQVFVGRRLPPVPGSSPNFFPSGEDEARNRALRREREQREQRNGRAGRGRGGMDRGGMGGMNRGGSGGRGGGYTPRSNERFY